MVIAHTDHIRATFGEGNPLKVAREHSDEILKRSKEFIDRPEDQGLDRARHLYDRKVPKAL